MFDFGARIKQLRTARNMSQEELGKKLNRNKSVICGYENNVRTPPFSILADMAAIFNVSIDYLAGIDKNEMVSLNGMNESQKKLIYSLVGELKNGSAHYPGLTTNQQEILNNLMIEFYLKNK